MKKIHLSRSLKYSLFIVVFFLFAFVYSFWGSKIASQNDKYKKTAEAYGLSTLYAEPKTLLKIGVWQRNTKETADYPDKASYDKFFYDVVPLELKEGASVEITALPRVIPVDPVIEVSFDGDMRGFFDISANNMVSYTGETDTTPANRGGGDIEVRVNYDGTFEGNRKMTLRFDNWCSIILNDLSYDPRRGGDNVYGEMISSAEAGSNFSFKDYYYLERFHEAYPDTPVSEDNYRALRDFKRVVMTNYVTIYAMHPLKFDTPVATAVLEITLYSCWYGELNDMQTAYVYTKCDPSVHSGKITVVSYKQSDTYAME